MFVGDVFIARDMMVLPGMLKQGAVECMRHASSQETTFIRTQDQLWNKRIQGLDSVTSAPQNAPAVPVYS